MSYICRYTFVCLALYPPSAIRFAANEHLITLRKALFVLIICYIRDVVH